MKMKEEKKAIKTNRTYKIESDIYFKAKKIMEKNGMKIGTFIYMKIVEYLNENEVD